VSAHACADTAPGVFAAHGVGCTPLEPLRQRRDRQGWRVGDEQVHVVGFAVELDQLGVEFCAHVPQRVLAKRHHLIGEKPASVLGYEHKVCVQQRQLCLARR
jgi:hypothetical protein